jgi:hypothetical protein
LAASAVITAVVIARSGSATIQSLQAAVRAAGKASVGQPPWPRPADTAQRAADVGLQVGASEGTAVHFHVHLDVFVNGSPVPVPANLGAGTADLAELHTHDTSGVIHVEAPKKGAWVLGQLFDEWNVRLSPLQIGGLTATASKPLAAYVDGEAATINPAAIRLAPHQEIALVYGARPATIPSSYTFTRGE